MDRRIFLWLMALAALCSAWWAYHLVEVHHDAVAHELEPGLLCGPEGGCSAILASPYAELLGVAVSAPAVPLYLMLLALAVLAGAGRIAMQRVAGAALLSGLVAIPFSAVLLYRMLVTIGEICRYCLVMDAFTLLTVGLGVLVHPEGPRGAVSELRTSLWNLVRPAPEATLLPAVLVGTLALVHWGPQPHPPPPPVEVVLAPVPEPPVAAAPTEVTAKTERPDTRRLVLTDEIEEIRLDASVPIRGAKKGAVTLVLFEDFQCPYCKKLTGYVDALLQRRQDVKVAFVHFPMHSGCNATELRKDLHEHACGAALAAVCAQQQGKFWEMHDLLFQRAPNLRSRDLVAYASELGLDRERFQACLRSKSAMDKVLADSRLGGEAGVNGTPMFFLNGRRLSGAQPVEVLEAAADAVLRQDGRIVLDVPLEGEVTGAVSGPAEVAVEGRLGTFHIDAFEASLVNGVAVSEPGVAPARGVTWYEADRACKAAEKRLCTEEEWLHACAGQAPVDADGDGLFSDDPIRGNPYPYGAFQQPAWCASSRTKDDPDALLTGNHPKCATPTGVYDLEGGVKEWIGTAPSMAGLKGGSYYSGTSARCGFLKDGEAPDLRDDATGFRCCRGPLSEDAAGDLHPGGKVGDALLEFEGTTLAGPRLSSRELKGKPVILTFWASWCAPCRKEMPALSQMHEKYQDQGLVVVGVNIDQNRAAAERFLATTHVSFPILLDPSSELMGRFDTRGVPTTFWVSSDGQIRRRTVGYEDDQRTKLEADVLSLLNAR